MHREWMERWSALAYPRRCPFCGGILSLTGSVCCPDCRDEEKRLAHDPPRLPKTEHDFYAVTGAAGAYYYEDRVRRAVLLCKRGDKPFYAREMADCMAVRIWGAAPAAKPGGRPALALGSLPWYSCLIPVPPREKIPGKPNLPSLLTQRLGILMELPVQEPLRVIKPMRPQKELDKQQRLENTKNAYGVQPGTDLTGQRILLVDDVITTGATVSACALALLQAGAAEVFAACFAADEELPKEKQKTKGEKK